MRGPGKKRKSSITDVILILLVIVLAYALYTLVGGNWATITHLGEGPGSPGPFSQIAESLGAFGQGLRDMFGNIAP